ncbi:ABC transporter substrate-binding protein [Microbacterium sp. cx-55]|uniref:ABC transporter substrate-binding protein n=1 Tax=Microbacterium sp. cx-55 TaxID=2875948 RepID=UPI001CBD5CB4|nr:ABC transporter substrate-binding protein [Microbacterium sp. cx-55]MBZ4485883.1 hypothetical protein [Microbacterium sp. cx-55]UGB34241.1 ABC transporter substrate-binding protein [Microbacterium sp. cx-55]
MRWRTRFTATIVVAALAVGLSACAPDDTDRLVPGSAITVALDAPVTSLNPAVLGQDGAANTALAALTTSGFWRRDAAGERVPQDRFGSIRVQSRDPLTVIYTVNDGVRWSDGARVDAADLLLTWAAGTTHRTGGKPDADGLPETRWNTGAGPDRGLDLVAETPEIGDDGRSITLVYTSPAADWESAFDAPPVAAHRVAMLGHPDDDLDTPAAKAALIAAVQDDDLDWLAPVSRAYREDFALGAVGANNAVTNGAYLIDAVSADGTRVDLRANPDGIGGPSPRVERVTVQAIPNAAERLAAVSRGDVDIAAAPATSESVAFAGQAAGAAVALGTGFDHLDLQTAGGGVFDPATYGGDEERARTVRTAFLATVPRAALLAALATPFVPDAEVRRSAVRPPDPVGDPHPLPTPEASAPAPETPPSPETSPAPDDAPDIDRARDLLAEADVPNPTVRLLFPANDSRRAAAFGLLAASAAEAGITLVDASRADWASRLSTPGEYDAALFAWDADPSAPVALAAGYATAGAANVSGWSDDTVDDLIAQLGAETDADARDPILDALDEQIAAQAWSLPLVPVPIVTVWSDAVTSVRPAAAANGVLTGFADWVPASAETRSE